MDGSAAVIRDGLRRVILRLGWVAGRYVTGFLGGSRAGLRRLSPAIGSKQNHSTVNLTVFANTRLGMSLKINVL